MPNKLFIGNLSWTTHDDGLRAAFEKYGEITEAKVITDRMTGKSRGFGFVTFADDAAAEKAKAVLVLELSAGQMLQDVQIAIQGSRPIHFHGRTGGNLIAPEEAAEKIRDVAEGRSKEVQHV